MDRLTITIQALFLIVLSTACNARQQAAPPSCATKLLPCLNSLNTSTPPETCCKSLTEAVTQDMQCLCVIFSSPDILKAFNLNLQQALNLSSGCGVSIGQTACTSAGPAAAPQVNFGTLAFKMNWIGAVMMMTIPFFCCTFL
ncbi:Bifunctional inhibitor/lipid-transfer protein/seed storage 2S albumin protein [Dioscorea alata]|uniref:Bifunctional inhibitor/lipid-transfer protein/seed storage 2S albumin protein n=1 Tax=Dioscorea alata TaxID=55571 RepID=A0ACB7WG08_DIOAL|nr:Bifunctional inhibitor/lipid-transfer protein/seed storage 2S albumin protein [Dioscorea alata]